DKVQMRHLFQNLITNAIKYRKPEVPCRVVVGGSLPPRSTFVEFQIADNGIGFDEKYLDRIFLPFQRLHTREEYSGTGIGLAICKKIVDRHGGIITARSEPGRGATFVVTLPAV
ncbi:MAG: ATP-binding protein, partial [Methanoregula sp.]|nr:ATP-binding protein [Methanoregula sp.]